MAFNILDYINPVSLLKKLNPFTLINAVIDNYLLGFLSKLLAKTGSGWKTPLGIILYTLQFMVSKCGELGIELVYCQTTAHFVDVFNQALANAGISVSDISLSLILAGLFDRYGKKKEEQALPPAKQ